MAKKSAKDPGPQDAVGMPLTPTAADVRPLGGAFVDNPYGPGVHEVTRVADTVAVMAGRGDLDPRQLEAARRYGAAAERVASGGRCTLGSEPVGGGSPDGPMDGVLTAARRLADAKRILGGFEWVVRAVVCDGWTLERVAARMPGGATRKTRSAASVVLSDSLRLLADAWMPDHPGPIASVHAPDYRPEFGAMETIAPGQSVHCTARRVYR